MPAKAQILIVDDCDDARGLLSLYIEKAGHTPIAAATGTEALEIISRQDIALVLMDLSMPEMGGFELLQKMRAKKRLIELPILMVTSNSEAAGFVRALHLGANDYVTKPVNMKVLVARISSQLSRRTAYINLDEMKDELLQGLSKRKEIEDRTREFCTTATNITRRLLAQQTEAITDCMKFEKSNPGESQRAIATAIRYIENIENDNRALGFTMASEFGTRVKRYFHEAEAEANASELDDATVERLLRIVAEFRTLLLSVAPEDLAFYKTVLFGDGNHSDERKEIAC